MNVDNAPLTRILTTPCNKSSSTRNFKSSTEPTTQQALTNMGLLSSFSILTTTPSSSSLPNTETTKTNSTLHNLNNAMSYPSTQRNSSSYELKIKMESVGGQPEQDEDLDMCPARTRAIWPRQLIPWWQPTQPQDKPPYSYATLIAYAILISQDGRLLLNDIYQWISETYPYYSLEQRGWQNSIRHNLSLNKKWFLKVDRRPTQTNPGKGCYWTLVPDTEEMFIENITQAGGHHRKHHDVGLTAELSKGQCNNIIAKQQQQQTPLSDSNDIAKTAFTSPMTSKPHKPPTPPSLAPMYSTFRMTSTTMESIAHDNSNTYCKKRPKVDHHTDNDKITHAAPAMTSTKRAKLDETQPDDLFTTAGDDTQSDCDSGVDVGNGYADGKIKNNSSIVFLAPSELTTASTNGQVRLYNVLDHFLDQLPLPDQQQSLGAFPSNQWETSGFQSDASLPSAVLPPSTGATFGFMNSCDIDPVLGYPSLNHYSTNGFYYGNDAITFSGADLKGIYPALLTPKYDTLCGINETMDDPQTTMIPAMTATPPTTTKENQQQQQLQEKADPLLVQFNGNGGGSCTGDEDMANAYLQFEDDDHMCTSNLLPLNVSDVDESTFMQSIGYQQNDSDEQLSYPFTTMCGLLES